MALIGILIGSVFVIGMFLDFLHLFGIHIPEIPLMLAIAAVIALFNAKKIFRTFDYLFTKHTALPTAPGGTGWMSTTHSEHQAEVERKLTEKLDADVEIARATVRLERARAALADAEREVKNGR